MVFSRFVPFVTYHLSTNGSGQRGSPIVFHTCQHPYKSGGRERVKQHRRRKRRPVVPSCILRRDPGARDGVHLLAPWKKSPARAPALSGGSTQWRLPGDSGGSKAYEPFYPCIQSLVNRGALLLALLPVSPVEPFIPTTCKECQSFFSHGGLGGSHTLYALANSTGESGLGV